MPLTIKYTQTKIYVLKRPETILRVETKSRNEEEEKYPGLCRPPLINCCQGYSLCKPHVYRKGTGAHRRICLPRGPPEGKRQESFWICIQCTPHISACLRWDKSKILIRTHFKNSICSLLCFKNIFILNYAMLISPTISRQLICYWVSLSWFRRHY